MSRRLQTHLVTRQLSLSPIRIRKGSLFGDANSEPGYRLGHSMGDDGHSRASQHHLCAWMGSITSYQTKDVTDLAADRVSFRNDQSVRRYRITARYLQ